MTNTETQKILSFMKNNISEPPSYVVGKLYHISNYEDSLNLCSSGKYGSN